jgi:uncharacterized delta-60 repeat protein
MKTLLVRASALFLPAVLGLLALASPPAAHASPGDLDPGFGTGGKVITKVGAAAGIDMVKSTAVQTDGKILVVGYVFNGTTNVFAVARYHGKAATGTPGTLDTGFGTGGIVTTPIGRSAYGNSVAVQPDGKIVVAGDIYTGTSGNWDFALARYHGNAATGTPGTLDTGFGTGGIVTTDIGPGYDIVSSVALQADGKIVVAGDSSASFTLARYHGDAATGTPGTLDTGFGTGGIATVGSIFGGCSSMALQADGKIVLAGFARTPIAPGVSNADFAVARFHGDAATGTPGTLDTGFGTGGIVTTELGGLGNNGSSADFANSVAVQADGKIVVGGVTGFEDMAVYKVGMVRYHGDAATGTPGTLDAGFGTGGIVITDVSGGAEGINGVALQADGKIVVAGYAKIPNSGSAGSNQNFLLARYHGDAATGAPGTLDTGFGTGGIVLTDFGAIDWASSVALQPDGNIVVAGYSYDGTETGPANGFALARYVGGKTIIVTNANDSGAGSLRAAVAAAEAGDTVVFKAGLGTIALASEIVPVTSVRIDGGIAGTTISGNHACRLFSVSSGGSLTLRNLTLTGGNGIQSGVPGSSGGAIYNDGTLTLTGCILSGNSVSASGGAIWSGHTLTMTQCTVSGNAATAGAIQVGGTATLTQCTFSGNVASTPGLGGGALVNTGTTTLIQCTLSGNQSSQGGAIYNSVRATVNLIHSTLSGNSASNSGGGICRSLLGTVTLTNTIISGNTAPTGPDICTGASPVTLITLVSGNTVPSGITAPSHATPLPLATLTGANFIGDTYGSGLTASATLLTTAQNGPVNLGPLANNGGPTQTMLPLRGSPVINAVPDAAIVAGLTTDQRGTGFRRQSGAHVDIGAVEYPSGNTRDLNGDGNDDLVLQHTNGAVFAWNLNGAGGIGSSGFIYNGPIPGWTVVGVADLNGDGNVDILFQHTSGAVFAWYRDGSGAIASSGFIYNGPLVGCRVVGVADLNQDGIQDIILQYSTGAVFVWYRNSSGGIGESKFIYNGAVPDWTAVGVADLNNDGHPDILLQNSSGAVFVWYLNGSGGIASSGFVYNGPVPGWRVAGVADLNNDGNADIFLQYANGAVFVWYLNGTGAIASSGFIYNGPVPGWLAH